MSTVSAFGSSPSRVLKEKSSKVSKEEIEDDSDSNDDWRADPLPDYLSFATDVLDGTKDWRLLVGDSQPRLASSPSLLIGDFLDVSAYIKGPQIGVAGTLLPLKDEVAMARSYAAKHVRVWLVLLVVAMVWSILTGVSFTTGDFWLRPSSAILGCLGVMCLAGTLMKIGYSRSV